MTFWYINRVIWCTTDNLARVINLLLLSMKDSYKKVAKQDLGNFATSWQSFYLCNSIIHNFNSVPGSTSGNLTYTFFINNLVAESAGLKLGEKLCNLCGIVNPSFPFPFTYKVTHLNMKKTIFHWKNQFQSY